MTDPHFSLLIVEDDDATIHLYSVIFSKIGDLIIAKHAEEALAALAGPLPDVAVIDARLPGPMDGLELVRRLRADERTAGLPIVVVTGMDPGDMDVALEAGADVVYFKPFDPRLIAATVARLAERPAGDTGAGRGR